MYSALAYAVELELLATNPMDRIHTPRVQPTDVVDCRIVVNPQQAGARCEALSPELYASPLARRPYDLRHAALPLWLNVGVPATQVAEWAGHSANVLLRVYTKCIYG